MNDELNLLPKITIWVLPILFAITAHEAAHAWVASKLGDNTAQRYGRITLNPIKHIDIIGTIIVPLVMLILSGIVFGWAKPVPVNWHNLRQPRRDMALVALAGPGANLFMAIFWAIIARFGVILSSYFESAVFFIYMGWAGIFINAILMIVNLVPILPLDGGRVVHSALPSNLAEPYARLEPFGFFILIALLVTNVLATILLPLIFLMCCQLSLLFGVPMPLSSCYG